MPKTTLDKWSVEDPTFWKTEGRSVAYRNLAISIPALLVAFAIWMCWSIITVQLKNAGYPFDDAQLFTLTAVAGLCGATLRIPHAFLIAISGGRNVIAWTTALLLLPAIGIGIACGSRDTPYATFVILAALSGLGGGNFASSMSNISPFFPRRMQGTALGLNAGIGNLGVSVMQAAIPLAVAIPLFGALGGRGLPAPLAGGQVTWLQNAGLIWVPVLVILSVAAWFGMNTLPTSKHESTPVSLLQITGLLLIGYATSAAGLYLLLGLKWTMWAVLPLTVVLTLVLLRMVPGTVGEKLVTQYAIFKNKHNWIMTLLYLMTFGSFIGYSAALPLLIKVVFGTLPGGHPNPHAPNPFVYAWLGPLVGSLARSLGGWIADKAGGARVLFWNTLAMMAAALLAAHFIKAASGAPQPEQQFVPFLAAFLALFVATGIGNAAVFGMVPAVIQSSLAGPVLGWISAIAAYGAFIIPRIFGSCVKAGTPEYALYGFTVFYAACLVLIWWFYSRRGATAH